MRKTLILLCLLLVPLFALAENNAQIVTFPTFTERVKLRERPDENARVLGQYYGGQPVEILEDGRKWHLISIGGRTGYMMQRYLTDLTGETDAPQAVIRHTEADGTLPLCDQAGGSGREIARMPGGARVEVLATVSQEWLHLRWTDADGSSVCGFASALCIVWPGETGRLQVDTGGNNSRLTLYAEPRQSARALGDYYSGTVVDALIEDSAVNGWKHVRIGDSTGYMRTKYLRGTDADTPLPTGRVRGESCPFYLTATDQQPAGTLFPAAEFMVVAEQDGRCQLMLGSEENDDAEWIWVRSQDIQYGYVTVAAPAADENWK